MYAILEKEFLSENVFRMVIRAEAVAAKRKPGQFVIIKLGEKGERIPLTIADANEKEGTITLIVQRVGASTHQFSLMNAGDCIPDILGPLGQATHVQKVGTVIAAGGGVGIAPLYPIAKAMKEAGNRLITVLAARCKDLLILEKEMRVFSDDVLVMTDDGSCGKKGLVTSGIEEVLQKEKVDLVVAIGPAIMMKFVALLTKKNNVPTIASLNTIMVDGTGMCGACRVTVGGKTKFVCVDGPEFDAHQIDYDEMLKRLNAYKIDEKISYDAYQESLKDGREHACQL